MKPTTSPPTPCQVLDPSTLGRPVHRLGRFAERWREDLVQLLSHGLNRRWRAAFEVGEVTLQRREVPPHAGRWMGFATEAGRIACAVERPLLLTLLALRYGGRRSVPSPAAADAPPATATEERLAATLALQFVEALAARIDAGPDGSESAAGRHPFRSAGVQVPRQAGWTVRVPLTDHSLGIDTALWFTLDDAWMDRLLSQLATPRARAADASESTRPLSQRLRLTLTARLLEKEMALGDLLDLRVGDLIPVRLGPTEVLVEEACLYTATVAEHQGKLCLTSFADAD